MRLIDAYLAKEMIVSHANEFSDVLNRREKALLIGGGTSCIDKCPTIEAEPVKHGRWEDFSSIWECDQCHKWFSLEQGTADMNYCPNCGAKMDGGAENE